MGCDNFQILIMGYIDGELTPEEKSKLEAHLKECFKCQQSLADYKKLREVSSKMRFKEPDKDIWDKQWQRIGNRLTKGIGWILLMVGIAIVAGFAIYQFIQEPGVEAVVKIGIFALFVGLILLLISVIFERVKEYKTEKYKEIYK